MCRVLLCVVGTILLRFELYDECVCESVLKALDAVILAASREFDVGAVGRRVDALVLEIEKALTNLEGAT